MPKNQPQLQNIIAVASFSAILIYWLNADHFGHEIISEIAIFAILAMSLDLIAGFTGLISLGHAALFGCGAYIYAYLTLFHNLNPAIATISATTIVTIFAATIASVIVRVQGIFFIIMTLALGSMAHEFFFKNKILGGDDGLAAIPRLNLNSISINTLDPQQFSLILIISTALIYATLIRIIKSPFGDMLQALHDNPKRTQMLGVSVQKYQTIAFSISAAIAAFAGCLSAQHTMFISPQILHWTTSGEILVMVILGGIQTIIGSLIGAIILVFLKHEISNYTDYWGFFLGLFLIITVLAGGRGIYSVIEKPYALFIAYKKNKHAQN